MLDVILTVIFFGLALFLYLQFKKSEQLRQTLSNQQQEKMQLEMRAVQAEKEMDLLRDNLNYERKKRSEDEQLLKEQLTAISKTVVMQSNQTLQHENQTQLETLLKPFKEKLNSFEQEVRTQKEKGIEQFASMESLVKALSEQHKHMNHTAQNLADALKGEQKTQGNWGELALVRILELSGLQEGIEYQKQQTLRNEQGELFRPDFLIRLPDNKHIVIDSKVSLTAFERYINAENDSIRQQALKSHLLSIHHHIKSLGEKDYAGLPGLNSPEFVLLFLPVESAFSLAIKEEPEIYARAWEKRVVIVTPSTLLATLKTIESIWKQERQTANALRIANEAGKLYDKFVGFIDDMKLIEKKQREAMSAYDQAMKKLQNGSGNLIGKMENLKILGAKTTKQLDQNNE